MKWRGLKYGLVYLVPAVVIFSIASKGPWSYSAIILIFGIIPLIEIFTSGSTHNLTEAEEELARHDRTYDLLLYGLVPAQYFILVFFLFQISTEGLSLAARIGMTLAFGLSCGILGINCAHELGHRSTWYEQWMSKALLLTSLYMHFFIEHNRGHHKNVSTEEDPASSRYGENIYLFYVRTIRDSWTSAWRLERERLRKKGLPFRSMQNQMLQFQLIQLSLIGLIWWFFGFTALMYFLAGAFMGILLLETVNYIEHYGLQRRKIGEKYERALPVHSWNSNHPVGRLVLLELSRHSDHHYMASRKYQVLRHFDDSPQMPTGYPGMMLLALLPPAWFSVMNKKVKWYKKQSETLS
jgi:alkane 1-monooxygenase